MICYRYSIRKTMLSLALVICLPATQQAVFGDGCFVWNKGVDIHEPSQKAIILYDDGQEDLILQVRYHGPTRDFGWLVPVPGEPKVEKASIESFYFLSRLIQTRQRYGRQAKDHMGSDNIRILEYKTVGAYDVATLAAEDGKALATWLKRNDFNWPDKGYEVLQHYIEKKWYFVAVKVNLGNAYNPDIAKKLQTGELHPLKITFKTQQCVYPLKISSLNKGDCSVDVYMISGKQPYICADMDFFSAQGFWPEGHYSASPEQFSAPSALVKDLPRLKNRKWYLYKHHQLFEPKTMHDLTFASTSADDLTLHGEKYLGAKFGPRLPKLMDNRHRAYAVAAAYHAPKTFERITLQLLKYGDPRSVNWINQINWEQAKANPDPVSRAVVQQWVGATNEDLRKQYLSYLFHMKRQATAGVRVVAAEISQPDVAMKRMEDLEAVGLFLQKYPDKVATRHIIALFQADRKAHPNVSSQYDFHLIRALAHTRSPEAAAAIGSCVGGKGEIAEALSSAIKAIGHKNGVEPLGKAINTYGFSKPHKHLFDVMWALDADAAFRLAVGWIDKQRNGQDDVIARLTEVDLTDTQVEQLCQRTSKLWKCRATNTVLRRHATNISKEIAKAEKAELETILKTLVEIRRQLWNPQDPEPIDTLISSVVMRLHE